MAVDVDVDGGGSEEPRPLVSGTEKEVVVGRAENAGEIGQDIGETEIRVAVAGDRVRVEAVARPHGGDVHVGAAAVHVYVDRKIAEIDNGADIDAVEVESR